MSDTLHSTASHVPYGLLTSAEITAESPTDTVAETGETETLTGMGEQAHATSGPSIPQLAPTNKTNTRKGVFLRLLPIV